MLTNGRRHSDVAKHLDFVSGPENRNSIFKLYLDLDSVQYIKISFHSPAYRSIYMVPPSEKNLCFGRQVEFELIIQCKRKVEREIPFQASAPGSFFNSPKIGKYLMFFISQEIQKQLWPAREIWCFPHWHVVHFIAKTLYI